MGIRDCSKHQQASTLHCPTCHKPLCGRCEIFDGCCSTRCRDMRQTFGDIRRVPRQSPWPARIQGLVMLAGAVYAGLAAAQHFGVDLPVKVPTPWKASGAGLEAGEVGGDEAEDEE